MSRVLSAALAAVFLLLIGAAPMASALGPSEVIASTFGPADSYNGDLAYPIQYFGPSDGLPNGYRLEHGARFQPTLADYRLDATRLAIFRRINNSALPQITIAKGDGPSGAPGTVLASKTIPGPVPLDVPAQVETAPPVTIDWTSQNVLLKAGQKYWMYLSWPSVAANELSWMVNSVGATGNVAARGHSYGDPNVWPPSTFNGDTPAFSVIGSRVPEPAAAMLALTAAAVLLAIRAELSPARRRR